MVSERNTLRNRKNTLWHTMQLHCYQMKWRPERSEAGVILLQTVILVLLLNLIAFTLVTVSTRSVQIEQLHHTQRQAYWLARSEARTVLAQLNSGISPTSQTVVLPSGDSVNLLVTTSNDTTVSVSITGRSGNAVDTIRFTYNLLTQSVTTWYDS